MMNMTDDEIVHRACVILEERMQYKTESEPFTNPNMAQKFCALNLHALEHEVFAVMFLDNQHRLLAFEKMFRGTIDNASVYPREIVKAALKYNASAVILTHNHPSGNNEPSKSDINLTDSLTKALKLVEVKVLDHIIVGSETTSMANRGLIVT